jgi:xanthine dehydrogenase accessory factor
MIELFENISHRCAAGERVALCTVVDARGSTPQVRGARMLITAAGQVLGTLGGGCVEAEVRQRAMAMLLGDATPQASTATPMSFRLDHDHGWDDGMWCGGILDVHVELVSGEADARRFAGIAGDLRAGRVATVTIEAVGFSETIEPAAPLVIAGAGHVAGALAPLASKSGFAVTVVDDRPDVLSPKRFGGCTLVAGTIDLELKKLPIDERTFVVVITRGHHRDAEALAAVIGSSARYVGMIGSKRKVRTILGQLAADGVPRERLAGVHAPIGLEIGAVTVEEIAVSILAELIAVRRGAGGGGEAMKLSREELDTWIDRERLG